MTTTTRTHPYAPAIVLVLALGGCADATTSGGDGEITATWTAGDDEPLEQPEESSDDEEGEPPAEPSSDAGTP